MAKSMLVGAWYPQPISFSLYPGHCTVSPAGHHIHPRRCGVEWPVLSASCRSLLLISSAVSQVLCQQQVEKNLGGSRLTAATKGDFAGDGRRIVGQEDLQFALGMGETRRRGNPPVQDEEDRFC